MTQPPRTPDRPMPTPSGPAPMPTPDGERFSVDDDAVGAMLRARADRVAPGSADTVRARVHVDLRERRPGGILGFLPIGDRAGALGGWAGWGMALAAAVLVVAVTGGLPTADPGATANPAGSPDPSASASASLEADLENSVGRLDLAAFALAVADGSLDGRILLVNGTLNRGNIACTYERCDPYWFTGLASIPVVWKGPPPRGDQTYPADYPFPGADDWWSGPFLVRPAGGDLELIGRLAGVLENPVSVRVALNDQRGYPNASSPFDILPVEGYLATCATTADCPPAGHLLSDLYPGRRGPTGGAGPVAVVEPAPELDADGVATGPFLVRFDNKAVAGSCPRLAKCSSAGWGPNPTVVGQYRAQDITRVDLPAMATPTSQPAPAPSDPLPIVSEPSPRETPSDDELSPALIAQPGAMTIATIDEEAPGAWILALTVVREDKPAVSGRFDLPVPEGWRPGDPAQARISADGWVAFEITSIEDRATDDNAIITVDPFGNGGLSRPILGSAPVWLPDGTLLFTIQARLDGGWLEVARRIPDHGLGTPVDLVLPPAPPWPWFPGHYVVDGDGSGILALKDEDPVSMTIRWDGSLVERDPGAAPYMDLGAERWAGAQGEVVVHCGFDTCPAEWRRSDGSRLPYPYLEHATAWLPDGSALLVLDGEVLVAVRDEGGVELDLRPIGKVPEAGQRGDVIGITGISEWAAAIEGDDSMVTLMPLDGSGARGPYAGTLAAVGG